MTIDTPIADESRTGPKTAGPSPDAPHYHPDTWNDLPIDPKKNVADFFEQMRDRAMGTFTLLQSSSLLSLGSMVALCEPDDEYPNRTKSRIKNLLPEKEVQDLVSLVNEHFSHQQTRANCYAYALDFREGTPGAKPDPGGKTAEFRSRLYRDYRDAIRDGAVEDGLIYTGPALPPVRENFYRAALFINDKKPSFHWLREDNNSPLWSHKDGHGPVKNLDYHGNPITTPHTAALGDYQLSDFFYIPKKGIKPKFLNADL